MRHVVLAVRSLRRSPGFSLAALFALSLGIGAATTIFSVADRILVRPLPFVDPDRLVTIGADIRSRGFSDWAVPPDEYEPWRRATRTLSDVAGFQTFGEVTFSRPEAPIELPVNRITVNFLALLGVTPALGRPFNEADYASWPQRAALLTDSTWRRYFASNHDIIGRTVTMNGEPTEIAGVLPRTFVFPSTDDVPGALVPLVRNKASSGSGIRLIGRLAPGASIERVRAEMNGIAASRRPESFLRDRSRIDGATVQSLNAALVEDSTSILWVLAAAVGVLVLIGCANVGNLLLARSTDKRGELALRAALGAGRGALVRMLLAEFSVLAFAGAAGGVLLAVVAVGAIGPLIPVELQTLGSPAVDWRALVFAAAAGVTVMLIAGLGPMLSRTRLHLLPALSQVSTRATGRGGRVRQMLVALEVALAVVLLVGGGLMVSTMVKLLGVDVGYTTDSMMTMRVQLPRGREYPARSKEFVQKVLAAARSVPGVASAGVSAGVPLARTLYAGHYRVEGFPDAWMTEGVSRAGPWGTQTQHVSSDFLAAAGIQVVAGRDLNAADDAGAPPVALISEWLARKFPPGLNPIGHYLTAAEDGSTDQSDRRLIVGVVRDVRDMQIDREALPAIYLPIQERGASGVTLFARTSVTPHAIAGALERAIQGQAGPVIVTDVLAMDQLITRSVGPRHLNAWLFGSFGVLGLLLAAVGLGSVVSYSVARRTREIGLRIALGATPSDVKWQVVRESMTAVGAGLGVGVGAALALSRYVESQLFGVQARDVWIYVIVCALLVVSAIVAALLPARRAARVDPLVALRAE